jgi:proteasome assembly chaperone (PAC2) family protein
MYEIHERPQLDAPVLVVRLEGWIDAGLAAAEAMRVLLAQASTSLVARFDTDALLDHRSRRPTMRLEDGVNRGLQWPAIELRAGRDRGGRDLLLLAGVEPDHRWPSFAQNVVGLAQELGVRMVVGLGAFPTMVPHSRPTLLTATASNVEVAARVGYLPGRMDVPAGIQAAIEEAAALAGIPALGLWARVPHYVAANSYPGAAAALLNGLAELAGLAIDTSELDRAADELRARINGAVEANDEHRASLRQLEADFDAAVASGTGITALGRSLGGSLGGLPTGDELAAEVEEFLQQFETRRDGGEPD